MADRRVSTKDVPDDRRVHERVLELENFRKIHTEEHTELAVVLTAGSQNMEKMAQSVSEIADVMKIYHNTRGAVELTKSAGKFILWVASIIVGLSAIGAAIKYWWMA